MKWIIRLRKLLTFLSVIASAFLYIRTPGLQFIVGAGLLFTLIEIWSQIYAISMRLDGQVQWLIRDTLIMQSAAALAMSALAYVFYTNGIMGLSSATPMWVSLFQLTAISYRTLNTTAILSNLK